MNAFEAYLYAAQWGSLMSSGDPGACMYGFSENCRPQSEDHRRDCLEWIDTKCLPLVAASPDDYDDDEAEKLAELRDYISKAPLADADLDDSDLSAFDPTPTDADRSAWNCPLPISRADLKSELTMYFGDGDSWGTTMQIWFGIAAELHFRNCDLVPDDWQYRPTPIRPDDPREHDDPLFDPLRLASTDALLFWGKVFTRYAAILKRAGVNY